MSKGKRQKENDDKETEKTKQYKVKKTGSKKKDGKKKHPKLKKFFLILFFLGLLVCLAGAGVFAGIFLSDKWAITKEELMVKNVNSVVYDIDNNVLTELSGDENRKEVTLADMAEKLPKAFVAIEDERFYKHHGVDIKRTAGATIKFLLKGSSSYGGSTITQQLVKNVTEEKDDEGAAGVKRKIREMSRAYQVEKMLSKDQILETYLNTIYLGGFGKNVCGVEMASKYYFNKTAKELDLAECAFLAGINNAPNMYDPFDKENDHSELIKKRTKTVLGKMKELGDITSEEEYRLAVEKVDSGLIFNQGDLPTSTSMSYHTSAALNQIAGQLAEEKDVSKDYARKLLVSGGYKIYTTQKTSVQTTMEEEFKKDTHIKKSKKTKNEETGEYEHSQAAMVIIDHKTGNVVGCVGGLGTDVNALGQNRATQSARQPGSSIKPIAVIAPGIEKGIITAGTTYDDTKTVFGNWDPKNSTGYQGLCTVRKAIEVSSNVVAAKIMSELGPANSIKFMKELGITTIDTEKYNNLTLSLGTPDINPLEMAAAYATIANDGTYIQPTFFTKVEDSNGNVVIEAKQETRKVMSESNAYIVKSILTEPVVGGSGTARACSIKGIEVAAKTGTTDDNFDKWLCGFTPYYTAATWYGFDTREYISFSGTQPAAKLWANIMTNVHKELPSKSFEKTSNIVTATICKDSGKVATKSCSRTYTEFFVKGTVPKECDGHVKLKLCKISGKIATEFCTEVEEKTFLAKPEKENTTSWKTNDGGKYNIVKDNCDVHVKPAENKVKVPNVIGMTQSKAKNELEKLKLKVEIREGNDKNKEDGIVLNQNILDGTEVKEGETIVITVNKKKTSTEPGNTITNQITDNTIDNNTGGTNTVDNSIGGTNQVANEVVTE